MKAVTLSYDLGGLDTGNPDHGADILSEDTGDATLAAALGEQNAFPDANGDAAGIGESLGMLAGAGLGSLIGPAGTALGSGLGKIAGGAVERLAQTPRKSPPSRPARRRLSKNEMKILADGDKMTQRTGNRAYAEEASLRVYRPAEYQRRRAAGTLPTQLAPQSSKAPPSSKAPAHKPLPAPAPKPRVWLTPDIVEAARRSRAAMPPDAHPQVQHDPPPESEEAVFEEMEEVESEYNETAAPDARPNPVRHVSVTPLPQNYMEALVRDVPAVKSLDPRLLRLASGNVNVARDVSGVDASTGTYHALPGETPHGITKKLTGQVERVAELLAANPGKPAASNVWNIPPGWLVYDRETGALTTARKYVVQSGDSPIVIAKKLGASSRPKWFAELSAANPQKPVKNGNFASLFPGEELGVPDSWPEHPLAVSTGNVPQSTQAPASSAQPSTPSPAPNPGLPGAGQNATMDPGAILQVQLMLARWGRRYPNAINPSDFGTTYDFTSTMTPRTVQAVQSFQLWWNRERPLRPLRMDGALDNDTMTAIKEAEQVASTYGQPPAYPMPAPQQPAPHFPFPVPQSPPPGWPQGFPWPSQTQPQPAPQQPPPAPQPQQPQPSPQQPQHPNQTAPQFSFPLPQTPPAGWPPGFPWPPFPGQTQPQPAPQQPQQPPAPAPQQHPAPQQPQTPPAGWPPGFPWPQFPGQTQQQQPQQQPQQQQPAPQPFPQQQLPAPPNRSPGMPQPGPNTSQWPYGWPWGWPWGQTPQSPQQQQPAPQQQQQPAPQPQPAPQQQPPPQQQPAPWPFPTFPFPTPQWSMPGGNSAIPQQPPPPAPAPNPQTPQTAPGTAFPPLDAHMSESDRRSAQSILMNETRLDSLAWVANMYESMGYPRAAAALRARMNALSAPLDTHMPEDTKQIVRSILQNETRPESLEMAAMMYEAMGYPMAGYAMRQRATYLRSGQTSHTPTDVPESPVVTYPDNSQQTAAPEANKNSFLPALALIGAGLAFT